jgi:hypothetical protein
VTTNPTRLSRAIAIRDHVLPLVRERGVPERFKVGDGFVSATRWKHAVFTFWLWTPNYTPTRGPVDYAVAVAVQDAAEAALPYGLDVWHSGIGKVLSLEWDQGDRARLISMRPGSWESELLSVT